MLQEVIIRYNKKVFSSHFFLRGVIFGTNRSYKKRAGVIKGFFGRETCPNGGVFSTKPHPLRLILIFLYLP